MTFPIGLILKGRPCLIVGGGEVASLRVDQLRSAGALITLVHSRLSGRLKEQFHQGLFKYLKRSFKPGDTQEIYLVFSTLRDQSISNLLLKQSLRQGFQLNCHDQPNYSTFVMPAIVDRGPFKIAITSGGTSPAISKRLREDLDGIFDGEFTHFLNWVSESREQLRKDKMTKKERMKRLQALIRGFKFSGKIQYAPRS